MATGQHILLIEDNRGDQENIRLMLKDVKEKYSLFFASSLAEGKLILQEEDIDLVLLDLGLPDSSGFQTLIRYLEFSASTPVVVLTGMHKQQIGTKAVRAGAQDFLVKEDFNRSQLLKSIRYSLERFRHQAAAEQLADNYSLEGDRLRELYRLASLGDWELDVVSNEMVWSDELFHILEEAPHSFSPTFSDYLKYVHTEDREKVGRFIATAMEKEESGPLEHRILIDHRKIKVLSVRTKISFDDKSNRVLLLGSVQDVTPPESLDEHGTDREVPPTDSRATEHNPPAAPRTLLNQVRFNIHTPLSTMVRRLEMLEQSSGSEQQKELMTELRVAFDDLSFTLEKLVNLFVLSPAKLSLAEENYRLLDLLESVQRVMSFRAVQRKRELDMYIDSRLAFPVVGDSNILGQLFFCLLELALSHSVEAAFLKLRCTLESHAGGEEKLVVQMEYSGSVPDWLCRQEQSRALLPVDVPRPESKLEPGDRLLAQVFVRLCDLLSAEYQLNTDKGEVYLDLEVPLQRRPQAEVLPAEPTRKLKILLVEDHPMQQIATRQLLAGWSERVEVGLANNGEEALLKLQKENFDLVLMDVQMPVMDGLKASAQIRATSTIPIIALTASASKQEQEHCYELGINEYLAKPFAADDLQNRIMKLTH